MFPEAARGTGDGSYPWDLPGTTGGHSKITNGTVKRGSAGDTLTLEFKNGAGTGTQRGASGALSADRVLVGKNGLVPPMQGPKHCRWRRRTIFATPVR